MQRGVVEAAFKFYRKAGVAKANIRFEKHDKAAHAFLTENAGLACGETGPPYINDCDIDQAKAILDWLAGPLQPASAMVPESLVRFDQGLYAEDLGAAALDREGFVYIPQSCRTETECQVHVVFHGCKQGLAAIGDRFVKESGYARWAESNRIVLLFPQAVATTLNPNGCWDWWGYTGRDFLDRNAPQMLAVRRMLQKLATGN